MFGEIYNNVIKDLEVGLPGWLTYHNVDHTLYVLEKAELIAKKENIAGRDLMLVKIAALYHDTGFLVHREDHESLGCKKATKDLSKVLTQAELEKTCGMIRATKVPQRPGNILEKIVADADLEYLGTDHFEDFSKNLFHELLYFKPHLTEREWDEVQIVFLSKHTYHTNYCKEHIEPVKRRNMEIVRERLVAYKE